MKMRQPSGEAKRLGDLRVGTIQLAAGSLTATVDPATGGRVTSLTVGGVEVLGDVSATGRDRVRDSDVPNSHDWFRGIFPLAPWAGTLPDASFTFKGRRLRVRTDTDGTATHGVLAEAPWAVAEPPTQSSARLTAVFGQRATDGWPFDAFAHQNISLTDRCLHMRLTIEARGEAMPVIAGFHPWFRGRLDSGAYAQLDFEPKHRLVQRASAREPSTDLGDGSWDDLFTGLAEPPRISWPGGPSLTLESGAPVWVVYNRIPGAFCVEPWTGTDEGLQTGAIVTRDRPLIVDLVIRADPPSCRESHDAV